MFGCYFNPTATNPMSYLQIIIYRLNNGRLILSLSVYSLPSYINIEKTRKRKKKWKKNAII